MTKDEFIAGYCERSGITPETFDLYGKAVPCDCGEGVCQGWAYDTGGFSTHSVLLVGMPSASIGIPLNPGDLVISAAGPREILRFKPDGTIVLGEGYTPTEAANAFIETLRDALPSKAENDKLKERIEELEASNARRDRDWVLAMASALGTNSGFSVPLVPEAAPFRKLFAALVEREKNG